MTVQADNHSARVLVVDDEAAIRRTLSLLLTKAGHEVTESENIAAARQILDDWRPDLAIIDLRIGNDSGISLIELIEQRYPDVFEPEWLFGGKKHGWSLRYKKSRSFCTLIPEKNRCELLIVFGAKEREKAEAIKGELAPYTRKEYDDAKTYHDGKWLYLTIDSEDVVSDVVSLLALKRKPKRTESQPR